MKKSTLALAIAAALVGSTVAYADTTLYGSARVSVDWVDPPNNGNSSWDVYNDSSRLGVRGEEVLGGGLSAIYNYEFGVDVTDGGNLNSNRPKWVGLQGGFGSFTAGTQWSPYYNVIGIGDIFNTNRIFNYNSIYYLGNAFGVRDDNSLIYTTPNISGFSAQAMLVANGTASPNDPKNATQLVKFDSNNLLPANLSDNIDMWNISASYKNGPFFVGATYMQLEGPSFKQETFDVGKKKFVTWDGQPTWDGDQWGAAVGYNSGPFAVTLSYENGDLNRIFPDKSESYYLTGQYTFGPNVIRAAYGYISPDQNDFFLPVTNKNGKITGQTRVNLDNIDNFILGYQYNLSKRTRLWVEYLGSRSDSSNKKGETSLYGDSDIVSIGTRVDF